MARPKITGRATTLAWAFVHAVIPRAVDQSAQRALFQRLGIDERRCVYCGDPATDQDHFRALVSEGGPSGHFHTHSNLVPSCGPCNQSKGGTHWLAWMESTTAALSPTRRKIPDLAERIERLRRFEEEGRHIEPLALDDMKRLVGPALWDQYWNKLTAIKAELAHAQNLADQISAKLEEAWTRAHPGPAAQALVSRDSAPGPAVRSPCQSEPADATPAARGAVA